MAFEPDIVVTAQDDPRINLVVEAKTHLRDMERTEAGLKRYMVGMQCPIGLLITPEHLWLYRDSYVALTPDSVIRVGDFNISEGIWGQTPPSQSSRFESFVQQWLEDLPQRPLFSFPPDLSDAIREYIIPAVTTGEVRAAHPR